MFTAAAGLLALSALFPQSPAAQAPAPAVPACTAPAGNPEALYDELNDFCTQRFRQVLEIDPQDEDARSKLAGIRRRIESAVERFEAAIECGALRGTLAAERAAVMGERARLFRRLASEADVAADPNALLDEELQENDPSDVYPLRLHNRLQYLDRGDEHRDAVLETIRSAERYVHMSYFEMYPDRMGYTVAALLIAKKIGVQSPCGVAQVARELGLPEPLNAGECGADRPLVTGPLPTADFTRPKARDLLAGARRLKDRHPTLAPIEVQLYLDNSKKSEFKLAKDGIAGALALFGVETNIELGAAFLNTHDNNHTKITASERRAVISGGNIVDKVMDWTAVRQWRDAAMLVEGDLVNDINHFFTAKFRGVRHQDLDAILCRGDASCLDGYFPASNRDRPEFTAPGRLIWSSNFDLKTTPTWKALRDVINTAQRSLYFENAFYSDGFITFPLIAKARAWRLRELKAANGEEAKTSTCGPDYFTTVARRPGGRFMLVVLPRDMDQPFVKAAEGVLTNHLVYWGVDVCKWSGKLDNRVHASADGRRFEPKTMMHSKVFMADERIAYVGTANLNRRSLLGDLEIGILTEDPETVQDIHRRMFVNDVQASEPVRFNLLRFLFLPLQWFLNLTGIT
ncbi:MAG: phosphatidylserine/phosphatidylglycerophosphate/cardiolipin synthase family protein [Vicinamibacterales bacterium]